MNEEEMHKTYHRFVDLIPKEPQENFSYWRSGNLILCQTELECNWLADLMDRLFDLSTSTGYFDPFEDARDGLTDEMTGWYYIDLT